MPATAVTAPGRYNDGITRESYVDFELKSMIDFDLAKVAGVMNRGFSDYFVEIELDAAYAVVSDVGAPRIAIRSIVVHPRSRGQGQAKRMLLALMAGYPAKEWAVPALCPEDMGWVFESAGFQLGDLAQLHMANEWPQATAAP